MSETLPHVVIVGAGLSGLSAAHALLHDESSPRCRVTILEASHRAGGVIQTRQEFGCLIERGADSFITNKPYAIDLCRRLGLEDELLTTNEQWRRSLVLSNGRPVPVPNGFQLMVPSDGWALLKSPLLSWPGKMRCLAERFLPPRKEIDDDESVAAFVRRRFGREALERLVQPLVGGIYTADPEKLSLKATLPRFPQMERQYGSVIRGVLAKQKSNNEDQEKASGARYGLFLSLRNGMSQLIDALVDSVANKAKLRFESVVSRVQKTESGWVVGLKDGLEEISCDAVVLTTPAWRTADLISNFDAETATALRGIEYASSVVVASVHDLDSFTHPLDAFGLVIPAREGRSILAVSFSSRKFVGRAPEGKVVLRTFMGGALQPEIADLPDDELLNIHARELGSVLGMHRPSRETLISRYPRAMPQYLIGHTARCEQIEAAFANHAGLEFCGSSLRGVGIPDCIASGQAAVKRVGERLAVSG